MYTHSPLKRNSGWLAVALALLWLSSPAFASSGGAMIVLESYAESRPDDAGKLLAPLIDELGLRSFVGSEELAGQVRRRVSTGAQTLSKSELAEARRFVTSGVGQYRESNYEASITAIERALQRLRAAPLTMVRDQQTRDLLLEALIYLAQANARLGKAVPATRAMAELIRSFPDKEISHARHGPEPRQLYRKVKADLTSQGLGRLAITIDDPRSVVFVNERYVGVGSTALDELFPGRYRVFVQQGEQAGRLHEVDVEAGSDAALDITWGIDGALRTDGAFVGFVFPSEAERTEQEAGYAIRLSRALDATAVALVEVRDYRGRRSIVGTLYSNDSTKPVRSAALAIEPVAPTEDEVRAMARFLAGDEAAAGMFANLAGADKPDKPTPLRGERDDGDRPYRTWKWLGLLSGVASIGTGVTLIAIHEPDTVDGHRNENARNTRTAGIITTAVGGVLTLAGAYLWIRDRKDARAARVTLAPAPGGALFAITGSF